MINLKSETSDCQIEIPCNLFTFAWCHDGHACFRLFFCVTIADVILCKQRLVSNKKIGN